MMTAARNFPARIGCAGWSVATAHAHLFEGGGSVLARYASRFNAVEINSSFHRSHKRDTYQRWSDAVPGNFRFTAKLPKWVTHEQRLQGCGPSLDRFLLEVAGLGDKLAGLLVQLPPSLAYDARVAATFFAMLRRRTDLPLACEPRHASWFEAPAESLWQRHSVTRVAADPARLEAAQRVGGAGPWRYWRWHGSPRMYYSAYSDEALDELAAEIRRDTPAGVQAWILFDNTAHSHATNDAARLQQRLSQGLQEP